MILEIPFRERNHGHSAAGLEIGDSIIHNDCPDSDTRIKVAGEIQIADGTSVHAALILFEFRNYFHRPNFRSAAENPCGETRKRASTADMPL